ncbi:hypothetical protein Tsubulata_040308 [Turnera subulata]|uniref:Hyccin n=1 Tax=Turnera subulata TaxID=218843 RepID=A0A9Q0F4Y3_9ROSI|nr:hypothetical protein Tsubulata_040308 [Turnera subulata]
MDSNATNHHHQNHQITATFSPSSSASSSTSSTPHPTTTTVTSATTAPDPMQSWWESVSKARSRILSLSSLLPNSSSSFSLSSLADSDRPALSFLSSLDAYHLFSSSLSSPSSGSGSDPLCHWLYDTYLSSDPHLRLAVLSFLPLLAGTYLSRIHSSSSSAAAPSLAGFEAVLLAIYSSEVKSRAGKAFTVQIPDLSQPSLYHTPRNGVHGGDHAQNGHNKPSTVGVLSAPLEPQVAVKSTKRPVIIGVALDCYFKHVSQMPSWSKVELCEFAAAWAGQDCPCQDRFDTEKDSRSELNNGYFLEGNYSNKLSNGYGSDGDENEIAIVEEKMENLVIQGSNSKGSRIPLPWEILQPLLRILGHCLLGPLNTQDVKDAASVAVRRLYARGSHDLVPQAILATRSLVQLDKRAREAAKTAAASASANSSSNVNTPSKAKKPEILLVSK